MTRLDDSLRDLADAARREGTSLPLADLKHRVRRGRRVRRATAAGVVAAGVVGVGVAAASLGLPDWRGTEPPPAATSAPPAVVAPLTGTTVACGTSEAALAPTTTLTLTGPGGAAVPGVLDGGGDVGALELTNHGEEAFVAASNGFARTVLVDDGAVVAVPMGGPDPFHPVDLAPGGSQPLGITPTGPCDGGALAPGTYTGYYVLDVDALGSPAELDGWDGTTGTPTTIVSSPFEVTVGASRQELGSWGCGEQVPASAILTNGLRLAAHHDGGPLRLSALNLTPGPVQADTSGWAGVILVRDGTVVASTVAFPAPFDVVDLGPGESSDLSYSEPEWCPGAEDPEGDPSRYVAYGWLDVTPTTGTDADVIEGGPWAVTADDLAIVTPNHLLGSEPG